ncbi:sensor domain-containing protein [Mycobacterium angelicum]|uniref:sensor domain-containing protein n=1 Tax=Mycobacterium angelicum TaxID=470074 RepID=UPI0009F3649A|nr:sensor domain-containing protein [Mycobacterium angelicum]MCV7198072.1 sensor domain-containing protein [Mycobacterium angelicum]
MSATPAGRIRPRSDSGTGEFPARSSRRALRSAVYGAALCVALGGCSTVVAGSPKAASSRPGSGGPIRPSQLDDLLTPSASFSVLPDKPLVEDDMQSALFIGADPAGCHGVVAFGRFPLFPPTYTGREARTQQDHQTNQHQLLEVSATYPSSFDAAGFLASVRSSVSSCQHPVTAWGDDGRKMTVNPAPLAPSPPEAAQWMTNLAGQQWVCEFAVIAKANVASELVTCSPDRSIDIGALVAKRIKKIDELLKSTA